MGLTPSRDQVGPQKANNSNIAGPPIFSEGSGGWLEVIIAAA